MTYFEFQEKTELASSDLAQAKGKPKKKGKR